MGTLSQVRSTKDVVKNTYLSKQEKLRTTVILGDPRLPDKVKKEGKFNKEDLETIQELKQTLKLLKDFDFDYLDNHKTLFQELLHHRPNFVFNLCDEGFNNQATQELHVPALLEMLNIPYTGAGPSCLALCYNKAATRLIAQNIGVPVPLEIYHSPSFSKVPSFPALPAIIKPNFGDGSYGITQHSVVSTQEEFDNQMNALQIQGFHSSLLIQEFLSGREFSVGIIGNPGSLEVLPILEIDYSSLPSHLPKLLSYESKWHPGSPYWEQVKFKAADISHAIKRQLKDYSAALFEQMECRDYARFDFRSDASANVKLLEVNPNPGFNWLTLDDYADEKLLNKILTAARKRWHL
ncbi:MAG: hypothetical protein BGO43_10465 [Gammaproteobacteria bacterium 39-13]|nr:MAG: hypothetical protein BGO43_10465 [Gammaproteobacteria bacterium 39-13]